MKGWVYVISTLGMPDKVKVGCTERDPDIRAKELNGTASPYPHVVDYEMLVDNYRHIEVHAHRLLKDYHAGKEWFDCSAETAIIAIQNAARNHQVYLENFKRTDREKIEQKRERLVKQQEEAKKQAELIRQQEQAKQQELIEQQRLLKQQELIRQEQERKNQHSIIIKGATNTISSLFDLCCVIFVAIGIGVAIYTTYIQFNREKQPKNTVAKNYGLGNPSTKPAEVMKVNPTEILKVGSQLRVKDRDIYLQSMPLRGSSKIAVIPNNSILFIAQNNELHDWHNKKWGAVFVKYSGKMCELKNYDEQGCIKWEANKNITGWIYLGE